MECTMRDFFEDFRQGILKEFTDLSINCLIYSSFNNYARVFNSETFTKVNFTVSFEATWIIAIVESFGVSTTLVSTNSISTVIVVSVECVFGFTSVNSSGLQVTSKSIYLYVRTLLNIVFVAVRSCISMGFGDSVDPSGWNVLSMLTNEIISTKTTLRKKLLEIFKRIVSSTNKVFIQKFTVSNLESNMVMSLKVITILEALAFTLASKSVSSQ